MSPLSAPRAGYALLAGLWLSGCTPAAPKATPAPETRVAVVAESPPSASGESVLFDFSVDNALTWTELQWPELKVLLQRFPHPHAAAGASCDPNLPGTPPADRMGGILLPRVTSVRGSFTSAGAAQRAIFIDYCPGGSGVPRTRRILVLQGEAVVLDHELASDLQADEVIRAVDVDGDGLAELLLTFNSYNEKTTQHTEVAILYQLKAVPQRVLGRWTGIEQCYSGHDDMVTHKISYRRRGPAISFHDEAIQKHCYYPPAPPPPPPR